MGEDASHPEPDYLDRNQNGTGILVRYNWIWIQVLVLNNFSNCMLTPKLGEKATNYICVLYLISVLYFTTIAYDNIIYTSSDNLCDLYN